MKNKIEKYDYLDKLENIGYIFIIMLFFKYIFYPFNCKTDT